MDPVVFFKLQLVLFFEGMRSERELMRVAADRLSVRWFLGYDLHEPLPDHSNLTRTRERFGLPVFRRFFEEIVKECAEAGLLRGEELFFDATKVDANASLDSLAPRFCVEAHLGGLFEDDERVSAAEPDRKLPSVADEGLKTERTPLAKTGSPETGARSGRSGASGTGARRISWLPIPTPTRPP